MQGVVVGVGVRVEQAVPTQVVWQAAPTQPVLGQELPTQGVVVAIPPIDMTGRFISVVLLVITVLVPPVPGEDETKLAVRGSSFNGL